MTTRVITILLLLLCGLSAHAKDKKKASNLAFVDGKWVAVNVPSDAVDHGKYPYHFTVVYGAFEPYSGCSGELQDDFGMHYFVREIAFLHCSMLTRGEEIQGKVEHRSLLASPDFRNDIVGMRMVDGKLKQFKWTITEQVQ